MKQIIGFGHNSKAMEQPREYKHLGNPPGQELGGEYASNWGFSGNVQRSASLDHYSKQARKGMQNPQGKVWQTQNPEHRHPVLVKLMPRLLQKYSRPYFAKVMVTANKTTKDLPKYGGKLHGKRDMCMHHILDKCRNPNCSFYHAQVK